MFQDVSGIQGAPRAFEGFLRSIDGVERSSMGFQESCKRFREKSVQGVLEYSRVTGVSEALLRVPGGFRRNLGAFGGVPGAYAVYWISNDCHNFRT